MCAAVGHPVRVLHRSRYAGLGVDGLAPGAWRELSAEEIEDRVREALALVDLSGTEERLPAELSGGMRKRVGIARAIALRPRYILYDEPTTGLDPARAAQTNRREIGGRSRRSDTRLNTLVSRAGKGAERAST